MSKKIKQVTLQKIMVHETFDDAVKAIEASIERSKNKLKLPPLPGSN